MASLEIMLAAVLAASTAPVGFSRPPNGYSIGKAFAAIVREDSEVDIRELSHTLELPELAHGALVWQGPVDSWHPHFSAYYAPTKSALGITRISIAWDAERLDPLDGHPNFILSLSIELQPNACPTEEEMVAATGVPMSESFVASTDGGPSHLSPSFNLPVGKDRLRQITYSRAPCTLSAFYVRER